QVVAFFSMLGEVEAGGFLLGGDAQSNGLIDDEEQDQRTHDGNSPGNGDAGRLVEQLGPVAVDGAGGHVFAEDRVDGAGGKEAGEQRADGSTGAMHAKGVKGVVVAEAAFNRKDHERADHAGDEADEERGEGLDEAGSGGDGDQPGDAAGDGAQSGGLAV